MKRAVVSGAAGFVGSHMCDRLLGEGIAVLALDSLLTGMERNIEHLRGRADFEFRRQDVTLPFEIDSSVDFVLHMASPASPGII